VLLDRIRARNRVWERPITSDFLEKVAQSYNDFFFRYRESALLVVNTSDLQMAEKEAHMDEVLSAIRRMGKGTQHVNPFVAKR
ncbi:MAG: deoxynucleoside kinase, partial [Myxococcota bacterium]